MSSSEKHQAEVIYTGPYAGWSLDDAVRSEFETLPPGIQAELRPEFERARASGWRGSVLGLMLRRFVEGDDLRADAKLVAIALCAKDLARPGSARPAGISARPRLVVNNDATAAPTNTTSADRSRSVSQGELRRWATAVIGGASVRLPQDRFVKNAREHFKPRRVTRGVCRQLWEELAPVSWKVGPGRPSETEVSPTSGGSD